MPLPAPALVAQIARQLRAARDEVALLLEALRLLDAVALVDRALVDRIVLVDDMGMSEADAQALRHAHAAVSRCRRGSSKTTAYLRGSTVGHSCSALLESSQSSFPKSSVGLELLRIFHWCDPLRAARRVRLPRSPGDQY